MAKSVEYHSGARADFDESFDWYRSRSARAAIGFLLAVDDAIEKIVADSNRFPLTHAGCRYCRLRRYPFRIVFLEEQDRFVIVAIAHAKRRPNYWKRRV
jgi:plasmid stabilization system protein ParE